MLNSFAINYIHKLCNLISPTLFAAMELYVFLIFAAFAFKAVTPQDCSYVLPEYKNNHACLEFDLSPLSSYGSYNVSQTGIGGFNYMMKVSFCYSFLKV